MRLKIKLFITLSLLFISFSSLSETCPSDEFMNNPINRDFFQPIYLKNYETIGTMILSVNFVSHVSWVDSTIIGGMVKCVYREEGSGIVFAMTQGGMGTWKPIDVRDSDNNQNWITVGSSSACGQSYTFFSREKCTFSR